MGNYHEIQHTQKMNDANSAVNYASTRFSIIVTLQSRTIDCFYINLIFQAMKVLYIACLIVSMLAIYR